MDRKPAKSLGKFVDFLSRFRVEIWGKFSRFRGENWGEMSRFRGENWGEMSRFRGENWGEMSRFRGENWGEGETLNPGETDRWSWLNLGDFVYSRSCAIFGVKFEVSSLFLRKNILKFIVFYQGSTLIYIFLSLYINLDCYLLSNTEF